MSVASESSISHSQTFRSTCPRDCYDACGLMVQTENGSIIQVKGDPDHPVSRGKLCRKCSIGYNSLWLDSDKRLTKPLRRKGAKGEGSFEPISWDEAISTIADRLQKIIAAAGPQSILNTHYTGTFAAIGYHFPMRFFNRLGATEVNPDTICNNAGHVALDYVYGTSLTGFDPRTAKDSNCIMVWGGNPSVTAPHAHDHWLQERPGKLVVVDPIRTPTAAIADLHLQPYPGSDAALAFSIMNVLCRNHLVDEKFIDAHTVGWKELEHQITPCTPEWGQRQTGVSADAIVQAAKFYATGPSLLWLGQGFQRQPRGGNAMRACSILPALTGNVGKPGAGFLYLNGLGQRGIDDSYLLGSHLCSPDAQSIGQLDLAECLEDPKRARALFCWNINIVALNPQQNRLRAALSRSDLFTVAIDCFPTDTTDYADIVLPAASFLESDDLFASYFDVSLSAQVKVVEPMGEALANSEIFRRLAKALGFNNAELYECDADVIANLLQQSGLGHSFAELKQKGTVFVSPEPVIQFEELTFATPSGKIELASQSAHQDGLPLVPEPHADAKPAQGALRLLSPASPWTLNDTFANGEKIEKQMGTASVYVHPNEAGQRGLADGENVKLVNDTGELNVQLRFSLEVPPGVALSHKGRWPKRQTDRANVNVLNPGVKADMGESSSVHAVEVKLVAASS